MNSWIFVAYITFSTSGLHTITEYGLNKYQCEQMKATHEKVAAASRHIRMVALCEKWVVS